MYDEYITDGGALVLDVNPWSPLFVDVPARVVLAARRSGPSHASPRSDAKPRLISRRASPHSASIRHRHFLQERRQHGTQTTPPSVGFLCPSSAWFARCDTA